MKGPFLIPALLAFSLRLLAQDVIPRPADAVYKDGTVYYFTPRDTVSSSVTVGGNTTVAHCNSSGNCVDCSEVQVLTSWRNSRATVTSYVRKAHGSYLICCSTSAVLLRDAPCSSSFVCRTTSYVDLSVNMKFVTPSCGVVNRGNNETRNRSNRLITGVTSDGASD